MRNHNEKFRDMERSVLASTRRKASREDRRFAHKRERAVSRGALRQVRGIHDAEDFDEGAAVFANKSDIESMIEDRRCADKIAPIERWAVARVAQTPNLRSRDRAGRVAYFRVRFTATKAGRHALSHVAFAVGRVSGQQFGAYQSEPESAPATSDPPHAHLIRPGYVTRVNAVWRGSPNA
jgi:hypothetical protein